MNSINVQNIVLHELKRNESSGEIELHINDGKAHRDVCVESLVARMHDVFTSKSGKGYGYFDDQTCANDAFRATLDGYFVHGDKFSNTTNELAKLLHCEVVKYPFADEGVLVIAEYSRFGSHCLMIGLVPKKPALIAASSDDSLKLKNDEYLDIDHMAIAARLDLTSLLACQIGNKDNYVSFLRTGNKRTMNNFFVEYLGVETLDDSKKQNGVLIQAVEDFLSDSNAGTESRSMLERATHAYCNGQIKLGEDVSLKELSDTISGEFDTPFIDYIKEQGYELDDEFAGDRGTLKKLIKFSGTGGGLSVTFDTQLLNERVFYDIETDTLTIKGTPPAMRDILSRKAKQNLSK